MLVLNHLSFKFIEIYMKLYLKIKKYIHLCYVTLMFNYILFPLASECTKFNLIFLPFE